MQQSLLHGLSLGVAYRLIEAWLGEVQLDPKASWCSQGVVDEATICVEVRSSSSANWRWPQAKFCIRLSSGLPGELGISKVKNKEFVVTVPVNTQPTSFAT